MKKVLETLDRFGIKLKGSSGQHMLVDEGSLHLIADQVMPGARVIEVGSGPGNLTGLIAERAEQVTGIEIDRRFQGPLEEVQEEHGNVAIVFGDVLKTDLRAIIRKSPDSTWQVVGNIPYHISEPFLHEVADLPVQNVVLTVGERLGQTIRNDDPNNPGFTRLSLLRMAFFDTESIGTIPKSSFYPTPRTDSEVIKLTPKGSEVPSRRASSLLQSFFRNDGQTVAKILREAANSLSESDKALASKELRNRNARRAVNRELREVARGYDRGGVFTSGSERRKTATVTDFGLPSELLSTPFSLLDNKDIRLLARAVSDRLEK